MKTSTLLQRAKGRIENREHWCVGELATDVRGEPTLPTADDSWRWCALGAINAESGKVHQSPAMEVLELIAGGDLEVDSVVEVNDVFGHEAVMQLYDCAISAALSDEAGE